MLGLGLLGISGRTPFAFVAQRGLSLFECHPTLEVRALIADDPADVGKTLREAAEHRWWLDTPIPDNWADVPLVGIDKRQLDDAGVNLVLSALPGALAPDLDPRVASLGLPVVSESPGLRMQADIPLVVPDVNPDHLGLIEAQRKARGFGRGFIVSTPVCTAVIAAIALKPILMSFGLEVVVMTTMQALSGAGPTGVPAMKVIDSLVPYIPDEEEKLTAELRKILGTYTGEGIQSNPVALAATCTRVPVRDGHTLSTTVGCGRPASPEAVSEAFASFVGRSTELGLPSAPLHRIVLAAGVDRPQPVLDRDADEGRVVTVGRIRSHTACANGVAFVALGHNHNLGTVGNAVLTCELLVSEGLVAS